MSRLFRAEASSGGQTSLASAMSAWSSVVSTGAVSTRATGGGGGPAIASAATAQSTRCIRCVVVIAPVALALPGAATLGGRGRRALAVLGRLRDGWRHLGHPLGLRLQLLAQRVRLRLAAQLDQRLDVIGHRPEV